MKMSKIFNLPAKNNGVSIIEDSGNNCATFNLPNEAKAAVHAINMHDELVEMLDDIYKAFYQDLTTDNMPSCSEIHELLKKARSE